MKKTILYIILIILTISCKKSTVESCEDPILDSGLISTSLDFGNCFYSLEQETFIIKDSLSYHELKEKIKAQQIENFECSFPEIDFNTYTILGQYASGTGCTINFNRSVIADSTNNTVDYKISIIECGDCEMLGYSYNFILVEPKINDDFQVLFSKE